MRYIAILLVMCLIAATGCDSFFMIRSQVVDAVSGLPVTNAKASLVLKRDKDYFMGTQTTGTNGVVDRLINAHVSETAVLTVTKPGYQTWSTEFHGKPKPGFIILLQPERPNKASEAIGAPGAPQPQR